MDLPGTKAKTHNISPKKSMPRPIITTLKAKDKDKFLKAASEK